MLLRNNLMLLFAGLLAATLCGACSNSGRISEGEKSIESFQMTRARVTKAQTQVDETLAAMDQLTAPGDLEKAFKKYSSEVSELKTAGDNARKRAQAMRENVDEYVSKWQKEMETIQDPSIKASLTQRQEAVRANFAAVRSAADQARQAYEPFLRDNQEIQHALAIDLSPAALPGLKPAMQRAHSDGDALKSRLGFLNKQLEQMEAGLSPAGKAKGG